MEKENLYGFLMYTRCDITDDQNVNYFDYYFFLI